VKVLIGEKEYSIEFEHGWVERKQSGDWLLDEYDRREFTDCHIREERNGCRVIVATGRVVRFHTDPPNRRVARKQALKKALAAFDVNERPPFLHLAKARRKLFWDAYQMRGLSPERADDTASRPATSEESELADSPQVQQSEKAGGR
jgi:hypothetical protein